MVDMKTPTLKIGEEQVAVDERYTIWGTTRRRLFSFLLGYLCLASSLTVTIYYPLIDLIADRYGVTIQEINVTITLYIILQGIVPAFWSPLSDSWGRRPVYLLTYSIFTVSSLVLSIVDKNYPVLFVFRALQSIGSSAMMGMGYATVSDVVVHSERGKYFAPLLTMANLGPFVGPLIGGGIMRATDDPRWCFRALLIFGASSTLLIGWFMPETGRGVVGNGAVPAKGVWRTWWNVLTKNKTARALCGSRHREAASGESDKASGPELSGFNAGRTGKGKLVLPNPFAAFRLIFYADTFLILWLAGSTSGIFFVIPASISPVFGNIYGFDPFQVGLCFLPGAVGLLAAGFVSGRLMDWNYRHVAKEAGFEIDRVRGDDMRNFPIERARSRGSVPIIVALASALALYGWAVKQRFHPAVPLCLQALMGMMGATIHQIFDALIIDIFQDRPGVAAATKNITRCALGGFFVAVLDPMVHAMGYGWVFTFLGVINAVTCAAAVWVLNKWGMTWRLHRTSKEGQ